LAQFSNNPILNRIQPKPQDLGSRSTVPQILMEDRDSALQGADNSSSFMSQIDSGNGLEDPTPEQQDILDKAKEQILALNQQVLAHCGVDPTYFGLDGAEIDSQFQQAQIDEKKKEKKAAEAGGDFQTPSAQTPSTDAPVAETPMAETPMALVPTTEPTLA
jgi:hypothetical protein